MEKDEYQYQDPPRWSGFSGDDHKGLSTVLHRNGLEGAVTNENELNQGFSEISLLAVALMVGGAWANLWNTLGITLPFGGSIVVLYGLWVTGFGSLMIYISLAEFASSWPTSSGPQEWAYQLFSTKWRRSGSYMVAWSLSLLYLFATMSSLVISAKQIIGLATYFHPTYVPKPVHIWAVNVAFGLLCAIINLFAIRGMHRIQTFSLIVFIVGFFVWLIVPIARSPTHATGKEVFTGELNVTGWSTFVAFMIGTAGVSAAYGAPDSITHLAEETPRPDKDLPRMMVLTPIVSILTGTAMVLTFLFCGVSQLTLVVGGSAPFIPFLQATVRNTAGVTVLSVILIYVQFMACLECQMASSRTIFTFAREGGAFLPSYLGSVSRRLQIPFWSVLLNFVFCSAMTLIMIGSETALNVFMNCSGLLGFTTYLPLLLASVAAKRSFAKGPFSLGTLGWIPNGFAILYMLFLVTFWCYPYFKAWDKDSFNYNIGIVPGMLLIGIAVWWTSGRKTYLLHRPSQL